MARKAGSTHQHLEHVLRPRSVAVVGASRTRGTPGADLLYNLRTAGYCGRLYAVNAHADEIGGVPCVPSVTALPEAVDLAVVAVPAAVSLQVARDCATRGVRSLLFITAGFAEEGPVGLALQAELLQICRSAGMRLVGPNCMGVINSDPAIKLDATFSPVRTRPGRVAVVSQSGGLGIAVMSLADEMAIGLSVFVSIGNRADVSANDVLEFVEDDDGTDVVLMYVESFGNPRHFARIARRVSASTPIVAVKGGRSAVGALATASHTGSLISSSDATVAALFDQAGIIRAETLEELLDAGMLMSHYSLPTGPRVAIIANAGGLGVLAADTCESAGLAVPALGDDLRADLDRIRPGMATRNPIDMLPGATVDQFELVVRAAAASGQVDVVVAVIIPPSGGPHDEMVDRLLELAGQSPDGLPVLAVVVGDPVQTNGTAVFGAPERAIRALGHAWAHQRWRSDEHCDGAESEPNLQVDDAAAAKIVGAAAAHGGGWLDSADVDRLLSAYGIPILRTHTAADAAEAGRVAASIGGSVAIKASGPTLLHKTEAGAVLLGVEPGQAEAAAAGLLERLRAGGHSVERLVVQPMIGDGVELIVGVVHDATFGPIVACGAGGILTELLADVAIRLTPLAAADARRMLAKLKTYPLLTGYRGSAPLDVEAVVDVLLRVGRLADDQPHIAELDCNPLTVTPDGPVVVDARIRVLPDLG
ncbi:MAG TPA: acetate--CoA ligase family protein [Dermatophilaceae bacterium]|nr:acetate--CoA ligase family protein [Dermatophilaceae bacterium]